MLFNEILVLCFVLSTNIYVSIRTLILGWQTYKTFIKKF